MSEQVAIPAATAQAASGGVLIKLLLFATSLAVVPIGSYFLSLKYVWDGNDTFAAITAVVAANIVLVSYVLLSWLEEKSPKPKKEDEKKTQ